MYSLIVLGLIPGTNIAISFDAWLVIVLVGALVAVRYRRYTQLWSQTTPITVRLPLPASQLHQRVQ